MLNHDNPVLLFALPFAFWGVVRSYMVLAPRMLESSWRAQDTRDPREYMQARLAHKLWSSLWVAICVGAAALFFTVFK